MSFFNLLQSLSEQQPRFLEFKFELAVLDEGHDLVKTTHVKIVDTTDQLSVWMDNRY